MTPETSACTLAQAPRRRCVGVGVAVMMVGRRRAAAGRPGARGRPRRRQQLRQQLHRQDHGGRDQGHAHVAHPVRGGRAHQLAPPLHGAAAARRGGQGPPAGAGRPDRGPGSRTARLYQAERAPLARRGARFSRARSSASTAAPWSGRKPSPTTSTAARRSDDEDAPARIDHAQAGPPAPLRCNSLAGGRRRAGGAGPWRPWPRRRARPAARGRARAARRSCRSVPPRRRRAAAGDLAGSARRAQESRRAG